MTSIPLVRMLTDAGYGSRREASKLINAGLVEVNGRLATSYTEKVDPEVDSIVVTGAKVVPGMARRVYLLMNKPDGYLTSTEDDRDRPTVLDLLPESVRAAGLHPAGRLDEDTTGLLILTNDGQLTYELTHPRFEHEKEYWVATTGRLTDADVQRLEEGVEIEEQMTWPAKVRLLLGQSPFTYSITIHEGRKRQVRLMFAAIDQQVAMLKRVRMGGLYLGDLAEGSWRELTPPELKDLMRKRPERPPKEHEQTRGPANRRSSTFPGAPRHDSVMEGRPPRRFGPSSEPAAPARPEMRSEPGQASRPGAGVKSLVWRSSYEHPDADASLDGPGRRTTRHFDSRSDGGRDTGSAPERPFGHQADDRGPRSFDRPSYGGAERRDRPPMREGGPRPYVRRESGAYSERRYGRPADDRGPRSYDRPSYGGGAERRDRPPMRDGSARPYVRRESGAYSERPYGRPTDDRGPRSFDRPSYGGGAERRDRPPMREGGARPYVRRESGAHSERPYGRPTDDRGPRSFDRPRYSGDGERRDRPPMREGSARPYVRRESGAPSERPYGRPTDDRGPRSFDRSGYSASAERRDRPPMREGSARPYVRRDSGPNQHSSAGYPAAGGRNFRDVEHRSSSPVAGAPRRPSDGRLGPRRDDARAYTRDDRDHGQERDNRARTSTPARRAGGASRPPHPRAR